MKTYSPIDNIVSRDTQADLDRLQTHFENLGRVLFADAIDKERIANGEKPIAPLTERRIFDDDIEVYVEPAK
jgi:hypothetical protein